MSADSVIDLRSDTVTRPSPGMRAAMASADVGDDVFGEDPTVRALEERAAALLKKDAALFVPSGTMANQIALRLHTQPGDVVLVGEGAHCLSYESGAAAALAGIQLSIVGKGGLFTAWDVEGAHRPGSLVEPPTRLVCVENTHNRAGGLVWPARVLEELAQICGHRSLPMHLDGARLFNAAVASNRSVADLAAPFVTVSLCFSKGLGAPVGSIVAIPQGLADRARRVRKMLGGGMRQAGILAAAALYALEHNVPRLAEDHTHARLLAQALSSVEGLKVNLDRVQTNIVLVDLATRLGPAEVFVAKLAQRGVLVLPFGPRRLRLVTHLDVSESSCLQAAQRITDLVRAA